MCGSRGITMRLSTFFFKTVKEIPNDAELISHRLLVRGGYIRQVSAGVFSYLPVAVRALKKIETVIREEMDAIEGNEVNLPVTMPASLWEESGRYDSVGDELLRFEDRTGRRMLLAMTHEEAVTDMARYVINSYKQLPVMLYQIQTKFRDEPRVRGGLVRVREFVMKDAYSFHASQEDLEAYYDRAHVAYERIFKRCGVDHISVASDVGMMGGSGAHEFMAIADSGEDTLILCRSCSYRANREVAAASRDYVAGEHLPVRGGAYTGQKDNRRGF
jgi:prolyl-tRNA synthetase